MSFKSLLACSIVLASLSVQAIPPAPPAIYNKIKTTAAKNCTTVKEGINVADLIDTDELKFVLQLNKSQKGGILSVMQDGQVIENFEVICK